MAFMILAIFFFFVLVGLFFVGWQYMQLKQNVSRLQEEKALSALKVIADSTELNCEQSEDWCIDRDKLTAFTEYSNLYDKYWGIASIELLIVYPPRGQRVLSSPNIEPSGTGAGESNSCSSSTDHNGDGNPDYYVAQETVSHQLKPNQGRLDHQKIVRGDSYAPGGNAEYPILVYDNLKPGDRIKFTSVSGEINYNPEGSVVASCDKLSGESGYGGAIGGFYSNAAGKIIREVGLGDFEGGDGVEVLNNYDKLYVYVYESNDYRNNYGDNSGGCNFQVSKLVTHECDEALGNGDDSGIDDFGGSSGDLIFETSGSEPILCPAKDCDYYILYDSGQMNKQTYSAYVTVCEDIDRSHQICELGKLMLGVKISDDA